MARASASSVASAIDVSEAPNRTVINLYGATGGPLPFDGDIQLQSDADTTSVTPR